MVYKSMAIYFAVERVCVERCIKKYTTTKRNLHLVKKGLKQGESFKTLSGPFFDGLPILHLVPYKPLDVILKKSTS